MEDWPPQPPAPEAPAPQSPGPAVIPWEAPGRPWLPRLVDTVRLLFARPREAFAGVSLDSDVLKPFVFALIAGSFGFSLNLLWQGLAQSILPATSYTRYEIPAAFLPFVALCSPAIIALGVVINAAIFHLFLLIVGGARNGFAATLRVICYAQAAQALQVLPLCGGVLVFIALIAFLAIGFSIVHRIGAGRAAIAIALPVLFCCVCLGIAFVMGISTYLANSNLPSWNP
jgi:hypothetical protein